MKTTSDTQAPNDNAIQLAHRSPAPSLPSNAKLGIVTRPLTFAAALLVGGTLCSAQTVNIRSQQARFTVPSSGVSSTVISNWVDLADTVSPVLLNVSGLPPGATATFDVSSFSADGGANLNVTATDVPPGDYAVAINATGGATNTLTIALESARLWLGETNLTTTWSSPSSWSGATVPKVSDGVVFTQGGAQTNAAFSNCVVDVDAEIASLRFSQTNGNGRYHNLFIQPNRTLTISGPGGLLLLRDYTALAGQLQTTFGGTEGRLVVSNASANIGLLVDNQQAQVLDMSDLGFFLADVNRVGFGDFSLYPNYASLKANGYAGGSPYLLPRRFVGTWRLARTNIIRASYADPSGYADGLNRNYALTIGHNEREGTSTALNFNLGISNAFFLDSMCFSHMGAQSFVNFNTAFAASNSVAMFRNTNGGRMALLALSDAASPGLAGGDANGNLKMTADFGAGTVDILADRLYISRDRTNSRGFNCQGTLAFGQGTIDANQVILGFQETGNHTNTMYCQGTLRVTNTAVFVANDFLHLGYTTADVGDAGSAETGFGQITISSNGTVRANRILVGGVSRVSVNNNITINSGGKLVVTNGIGEDSSGAKLNQLSMSDGFLTLHVTSEQPKVFVRSLVTGGAGNVINIASLPTFASYPAQVTLISFESGAGNFTAGSMPSGLVVGSIVNKGNTIELTVNTNSPQTLVWRGNAGSAWDHSTKNWVTSEGIATNFHDGDFVVFDDSASGVTVSVNEDVQPGQSPTAPGMTVSNAVLSYTFTGAGTVQGSRLLKQGPGALTLNARLQSAVEVEGGSLFGTGEIGSTVIKAGVTASLSGNINGGLTSAGAVSSAGKITGPISLKGGYFVNNGFVNDSSLVNGTTFLGPISVSPGVFITNNAGGEMFFSSSWNIASNGVLANFGKIYQGGPAGGNNSLNINFGGLLTGSGLIQNASGVALKDGRVSINEGGQLKLGGSPMGSMAIQTRLDFMTGSTNIFRVDPIAAVNDVVSVSEMNYRNGTILLSKTGAGSYASGQAFTLINPLYGYNVPDNQTNNIYYQFVPLAPEFGLKWHHADLVTYGILRVTNITTTPTQLGSAVAFNGTNYTYTLSWPEEYTGWRLEGQTTNTLEVGLSTNWVTIANSFRTNQIIITIPTNNPPAISNAYYRLVYP